LDDIRGETGCISNIYQVSSKKFKNSNQEEINMADSPFDKLRGIKESHHSSDEDFQSPISKEIRTDSKEIHQQKGAETDNANKTKSEHDAAVKSVQGHMPKQPVNNSSNIIRVPTGIKGFDQLVQGGFKIGSVNLLSGGPGTGKTIFAMEYIVNGVLMFNEPGVFLSFDETKDSMFENMKSFGWDLQKLSDEGKFFFVDYNPSQLQQMLNEGGGLLDNLMVKARGKRLVIDSISTFLMMSSSEFSRREQLSSFFKMLKKWGVTTLLTNEYTPMTGNELSSESLSVDFETDSILQLYYNHENIGKERKRLIEVYKMRGTNHVTRAVPFNITKDGISIEPEESLD
jgi:KaiC/GvpD/RAD55 family RecA-like ATPase